MNDDTEKLTTIYQRLKPAQETVSFMQRVEGKFDSFETMSNGLNLKFELMNKDIQEIKDDMKELKATLKEFCETSDTKYASKNVERILFWAGALIGAGIIGAVLKTILK